MVTQARGVLRRAFARETTSSPEMYAAAARNWGEPGRLRRVFAKLLRGALQAELMACKGWLVCCAFARVFYSLRKAKRQRYSAWVGHSWGSVCARAKSSRMSAGVNVSEQSAKA